MNIEDYFNGIYELPETLSKEETESLLEESRMGLKEAKDKLTLHNIRLVLSRVSHISKNKQYYFNDLASIGVIGLIKAIDSYDPTKKTNFSTFAVTCIDNEIMMFLRQDNKHLNVDSIDTKALYSDGDQEIKLGDCLKNDNDLVTNFEKKEEYQIIRTLVSKLPDTEKDLIMLYFGFYNGKRYTQKDIAQKYHTSPRVVSEKIKKTLKVLKEQLASFEEVHNICKNNNNYAKQESLSKQESLKTSPNDEYHNKIFELLESPAFIRMRNILSLTEAIIVSVKLGYIDGTDYSAEEISTILGIDKEEVVQAINKIPLINHKNMITCLGYSEELQNKRISQDKKMLKKLLNKMPENIVND